MRRTNILYIILALATLICGCTEDGLRDLTVDDDGEGMVRIQIGSSIELGSDVSTRAIANEDDVTGIAVAMVFDKTDRATAVLKQVPVLVTAGGATGGKRFMSVYKEKTESYICLVQNITEENRDYLLGLDKGAKLAEISRLLTIDADPKGFPTRLPMSGWSAKLSTINRTTGKVVITFSKSVARIDINSLNAKFKIKNVIVANAPKRGYVLPQTLLPFAGLNDVVTYDPVPGNDGTSITSTIYCFEDRGVQGNNTYPTRLVIYGTRDGGSEATYYGVNIVYPSSAGSTTMSYHMTRNTIYTINLNTVAVDGYSTYEDALKSDPFNTVIDSDIIVTDPYSHDIVSNGQQYLGSTNAEFVVYPSKPGVGERNMTAATISYTSAATWGLGKVEASAGITLLEGVERLEIQEGAVPIYRDITIKQLADNFNKGTITITVGNLQKVINVRLNTPTLPIGQISNDYFVAPSTKGEYKIGEIINPSAETQWLKLSTSDKYEGSSSLNDKVETIGNSGIYIHIQPYITNSATISPREGYIYLTGELQNQRIRALVRQEGYDVKTSNKQITPHTYVGTFHRWNQTAERVINMPSTNTGWWHAEVVVGEDFIVLSADPSKDTKLGTTTPDYATDDAIEANCQVIDGQKTLTNTAAANNIYFRVGMKSKLSSQQAAPRYGLIAVTYGTGTSTHGVHNIFVRQGEAADYVMRPTDKTNSTEWPSNIRPKAVKFCPYNLTDIISPLIDLVTHGAGGYNFVRYPSQGGHFFLASGTQAINPKAPGILSGLVAPPPFSTSVAWSLDWETCPKGYRRPQDGLGRAYGTASATGDIENSEVRQSLWYTPTGGAEKPEATNQLFGYIADGYFDRRKIDAIGVGLPITDIVNGIVSKGTVDAAYCGMLTYNPFTYASIFTPFSGMYNPLAALNGVTNQGIHSSMQVSTPGATNDSGWLVNFGYTTDNGYAISIGQKGGASLTGALNGHSVRCIKDEKPPLNTDDSNVEIPGKGDDTHVVSMMYNSGTTLQTQIETNYNEADRKLIGTIAIGTAGKYFTDADYKYLNDWADKSDHKLTNVTLRGPGTEVIPTGAFTSSKWKSIHLSDAREFTSGAFTNTLTGLYEVRFNYMDAMTVALDAFGFTTEGVFLYLGAAEHKASSGQAWNGKNWEVIFGSK